MTTISRLLCRLRLHRWTRYRLLTDIKLLGMDYCVQPTFKVIDAEYVDQCDRCKLRRRVETRRS